MASLVRSVFDAVRGLRPTTVSVAPKGHFGKDADASPSPVL